MRFSSPRYLKTRLIFFRASCRLNFLAISLLCSRLFSKSFLSCPNLHHPPAAHRDGAPPLARAATALDVPDPGQAIGSRPLIGPGVRPEAAGGPPRQVPWTVHSPGSNLAELIEIPIRTLKIGRYPGFPGDMGH